MAKQTLSLTWDLETIFPGGSASPELVAFLEKWEADMKVWQGAIQSLQDPNQAPISVWRGLLEQNQDLAGRLRQASAFISCLTSANVKDEGAKLISGKIQSMMADLSSTLTQFDQLLLKVNDEAWQRLLQDEVLGQISFPLEERRRRATQRLAPEQEALAGDLAVDGYHAWSDLYYSIIGRMNVPFVENGTERLLSIGQAENKMSNPDRSVRQQVFNDYEKAFEGEAELFAVA